MRIIYLLTILIHFSATEIYAQCDINFCTEPPLLEVDAPIFDVTTGSIILNNISIGNFGCDEIDFIIGMEIYIYQLLPDGSRIFQCNVLNEAPNNVIGNISLNFGQFDSCDQAPFNLGTVEANPANGFEACDGAVYEIELILFVTDNTSYLPFQTNIYSQLPETQYFVLNIGTVEVSIVGDFPGNGQPLTTAILTDINGTAGSIDLNCGEDIELFVEGTSRIANCLPYDDLSTGIPSELINELFYTVNEGPPIIVQNASTGAAGGQITGPNTNGACYGGIYGDLIIPFSGIEGVCDGAIVEILLRTTDLYTNQTAEDSIIVNYSGATCTPCEFDCPVAIVAQNQQVCSNEIFDLNTSVFGNTDNATIIWTDSDGNIVDPNNLSIEIQSCNSEQFEYTVTVTCSEDPSIIYTDNAIVNVFPTDISMFVEPLENECTVSLIVNPNCIEAITADSFTANPGESGIINLSAVFNNDMCSTIYSVEVDYDCIEITGCTNSNACNFNPNAAVDDGTCIEAIEIDINTTCDTINIGMINVEFVITGGLPSINTLESYNITGNFVGTALANQINSIQVPNNSTLNIIVEDAEGCDGLFDQLVSLDCTEPCKVTAANLTLPNGTDTVTICVIDGLDEPIDVISTGGSGDNGDWIISDQTSGLILADNLQSPPFVLDGAGVGICLISYVTWSGDLSGLEIGEYLNTLEGDCFAVSNGITVFREECIIEVPGCIDPAACNYDPDANLDDGTCLQFDCNGDCGGNVMPGTICNDNNPYTINDVLNSNCDCVGEIIEVFGCTDSEANNYNPNATVDDGSCAFDCTSQAGTISIENGGIYNDSFICFGESVNVIESDFILATGQTIFYLYHNEPNPTIGNLPTEIYGVTNSLINNDASIGDIFVTAFGSTDNGDGLPNFNDPCLSISNTIPITLLSSIFEDVTLSCDDEDNLTWTTQLFGGLPQEVIDAVYFYEFTNPYNVVLSGAVLSGTNLFFNLPIIGETYTLEITDANGCQYVNQLENTCDILLPIELTELSASAEKEGNLVKWSTGSEIENDYFSLYHSVDGINFNLIEIVNGAGTSSLTNSYQYLHREAPTGVSYYKLSQTDFDGTTVEEGIVSVIRGEQTNQIMDMYPMPAVNQLNIVYQSANQTEIQFSIYNSLGELLISNNQSVTQGINDFNIALNNFASGIYIIHIENGDKVNTEKFIVE